jgi:hypothetical protein
MNEYKPFNEKIYFQAMWKKGLDPEWVEKQSKKLGNRVHNWIENSAYGVSDFFDEKPETPSQRGLRMAVNKFLAEFDILSSEKTIVSDRYGYAGRYDAKVRRKVDSKVFIADFKTWNAWKGDSEPLTFAEVKTLFRDKINKVSTQLTLYDEVEKVGNLLCLLFRTNGTYEQIELKRDEKILPWIDSNTAWIESGIQKALQSELTDIKYIDND